ncbi:hypothetical protein ACHQM5_017820 [Ranunculus cassubicifolius]
MVNRSCTINGTVDDTGYSSPVPVIGLYIAAASFLCMLLMLCDIIAGIRARKRWLPCKLFKLNSVILTLLSVAAKLPVDLTTPMPSPSDQLSKLSGTTFICISMGFLMPSLGVNPESESFTNMVALTIFIITVFVNICMQLSTGVIALFVSEHIIILCSLLMLLMLMWKSYWDITIMKKVSSEANKEIFTKGNGSVFQRLKTSCVYGYQWNPQLVACLKFSKNVTAMICTLCSASLIQAAFRSLIRKQLKFCSGHSDYEWSVPVILVTQILTIILGNSAVFSRWLTMSRYVTEFVQYFADKEVDDVIRTNPVLGIVSKLHKFGRTARSAFLNAMQWLVICIGFLPALASLLFWRVVDDRWDVAWSEWVQRKSEEHMEMWIDQSKSEPSNHLSQLLISRNYPYKQFDTMEVIDPSLPHKKGVYASSLSIVLLVRIAQVSLPENHSRSLVQAFGEANEVFYYIENITYPKNFENDTKLLFAKAVWAGKNFHCLHHRRKKYNRKPGYHSDLDLSLFIIRQLKTILPSDPVWYELGIIVDFINRKTYSTIEELVTSFEQMFVDMARIMLFQLPNAIFKSLTDSTEEEYEENVKLALKMTCKVESIAEHVQWSFPPGCNFTSLVTTEDAPQLDAIQQGVV